MKQSKTTRFIVAVNTGDDTLSPFDSIQTASAELARSLKARWSAQLHRELASRPDPVDPIDERRQSAKNR